MADRADAFAALPGGFGTADELFEILTWAHLGLHTKPIGLLNTGGFFDQPNIAVGNGVVWLDYTGNNGREARGARTITKATSPVIRNALARPP